jgi:hypothetical protein
VTKRSGVKQKISSGSLKKSSGNSQESHRLKQQPLQNIVAKSAPAEWDEVELWISKKP